MRKRGGGKGEERVELDQRGGGKNSKGHGRGEGHLGNKGALFPRERFC